MKHLTFTLIIGIALISNLSIANNLDVTPNEKSEPIKISYAMDLGELANFTVVEVKKKMKEELKKMSFSNETARYKIEVKFTLNEQENSISFEGPSKETQTGINKGVIDFYKLLIVAE